MWGALDGSGVKGIHSLEVRLRVRRRKIREVRGRSFGRKLVQEVVVAHIRSESEFTKGGKGV